jgi:hypothetical protein
MFSLRPTKPPDSLSRFNTSANRSRRFCRNPMLSTSRAMINIGYCKNFRLETFPLPPHLLQHQLAMCSPIPHSPTYKAPTLHMILHQSCLTRPSHFINGALIFVLVDSIQIILYSFDNCTKYLLIYDIQVYLGHHIRWCYFLPGGNPCCPWLEHSY